MEYSALSASQRREILAQMQALTRRFAAQLDDVREGMRPRDAERLGQQSERLLRRISAALELAEEENALDDLADLAVGVWKLERVTDRVLVRMSFLAAGPFANAARWYFSQMDAAFSCADVRAVDFTLERYSPGLPVKALNAHECEGDCLRIAQTVEPVIMAGGGVWRMGSVMLEEETP